jgi:UDP-N-acetylmuramate: L-alanyl-gamma-D-glutamyl-meso-diaminopimelate ligase
MGGLALLARQRGYVVAGCDAGVYPPMSTQLEAAGIDLDEGWDPQRLPADALIVVGNALSRGNPCVEAMLERDLRYVSGPQWLAEEVLRGQWVVAAAGTHGKTTVSSLIAWLLEAAGREPGFLIGGVPKNFGQSARAGAGECFVVEADEYDTAFFDKRAKFVTTDRAPWLSTTSNTTTRISTRISRQSSASSTTSCAACPPAACW